MRHLRAPQQRRMGLRTSSRICIVIWKRAIAAVIGMLAVVSGVVAFAYSVQALEDFQNPAVSFRLALLTTFLMCSIALGLVAFAFRFLRYAIRGAAPVIDDAFRILLLGAGCFFPGFIFSLPLTLFWTKHNRPGEIQDSLPALEASLCVGISAMVIGCIFLFNRRRRRRTQEFSRHK